MSTAAPKFGAKARQGRAVARLAAVQALYQMETAGAGAEAVLREFADFRFGGDIEGEPLAEADEAFFTEVVRGAVAEQARIDRAIADRLTTGWKLERLDATLRALMRAATYELLQRPDVPSEVAIDEYIELAKAFNFAPAEVGFVNAALDGIATDVRSGE